MLRLQAVLCSGSAEGSLRQGLPAFRGALGACKSSDGCSVSGPGSSNSAGLFAMFGLALLGLRARRRLKLDR